MSFMGSDFLLCGSSAQSLYHGVAADLPIVDFHCHINADEILENRRFNDLGEAWLEGDHYKWRLMRAAGISEEFITGDASFAQKFFAFAGMLPYAVGNPVYDWAHLELRRFFNCAKTFGIDSAEDIYSFCNDKLQNDPDLRVRGIIKRMKVKVIVTTDDPADDLSSHKALVTARAGARTGTQAEARAGDSSFDTQVLPGWRPGAVMNIESDGFAEYINKLGSVSGIKINDFDSLKAALLNRMEFFNSCGCRTSDHGIRQLVVSPLTYDEVNIIFLKGQRGEVLSAFEAEQYRYALMSFMGREYARLGWVMQLHLGVQRSINLNMFKLLGPDTGFDCIDPTADISGLAAFFDELNSTGTLPKTMIFSINPSFNQAVNTLAGCFSSDGVKSKVQQGSAWWFNDTAFGMEQQIIGFAEGGLLGNFVGMLTDSRSFLSYTRHEYFRRILCNYLGGLVDSGRYPDISSLKPLIENICYKNAISFFEF
jgi:glucuronate isomerase